MASVVKLPSVPNPSINESADYFARKGRPMLFSVLSPNSLDPLYSILLAMHINPNSLDERMVKSKNVVQTYGGFVEFVWADELDTLSAQGSTGAFISPDGGLTVGSDNISSRTTGVSTGRRGTMAWERQEDLLELFRSNGCVFNSVGQPVLRGRVMCIYDRGAYIGVFTTFEIDEDNSKPFQFSLSWEFKIEQSIYRVPTSVQIGG
jgi:hypothetical protein